MKVQEIFQGTFKLISIVGQVLYLRRQIIEHLNPRICSLLVYWQIRYWQIDHLILHKNEFNETYTAKVHVPGA